jgi:hypothetical protein
VTEKSTEELEADYKFWTSKGDEAEKSKARVEATLDARRKVLKDAMEQAKKEGYNPDQLPEEIRRAKEILALKIDNYKTELEEAEKILKPMVIEISKG